MLLHHNCYIIILVQKGLTTHGLDKARNPEKEHENNKRGINFARNYSCCDFSRYIYIYIYDLIMLFFLSKLQKHAQRIKMRDSLPNLLFRGLT